MFCLCFFLENSFEFKLQPSPKRHKATGIPQLPKLLYFDESRKNWRGFTHGFPVWGVSQYFGDPSQTSCFYFARQWWLGQHLVISWGKLEKKNWGDGNLRDVKIHKDECFWVRMDVQKPSFIMEIGTWDVSWIYLLFRFPNFDAWFFVPQLF